MGMLLIHAYPSSGALEQPPSDSAVSHPMMRLYQLSKRYIELQAEPWPAVVLRQRKSGFALDYFLSEQKIRLPGPVAGNNGVATPLIHAP